MERPAEAKRHISEPGEDLPLGAPVLYAGKVISAAAVAALAGAGIRDVSVHRRPRIALLSTGDELVGDRPLREPGGRARHLPPAGSPAAVPAERAHIVRQTGCAGEA